jgi:hypothetical protein
VPGQWDRARRQIEKVGMNDFAQFWVRHSSRLSIDDQNPFHIGMVQALEQDTFPDHARCPGYDCLDFHEVNSAPRNAEIGA